MPKLSLDVSHVLGQEEAARRLKEKFAAAHDEHRNHVSNFRQQWQDHTFSFGFSALGMPVSGTVAVEAEWIRLVADLPLAAMLLKGAIENRIRQELDGLLAPGTAADDTNQHETIVRETVCKTVLNRSTLGGYSLNCYTGCTHGCVYCYARFMQRFHPHAEPWGTFVDVKVNAVEVLKRQLRRAEPGEVFLSSACDGWQPIEAEFRLTRRCCELLLERGFQLNILTKRGLVTRDFDVFAGRPVRVGVTLTTLDQRLRRLWEPHAAGIHERTEVIEAARRAGLKTSVMFGPLLPFLSDSQAAIDALLQWAADMQVDAIWVDALNPRPRVWAAVAELLRAEFPELLPRYRQMLFDRAFREKYLAEIHARIDRAAKRALGKRSNIVEQCL